MNPKITKKRRIYLTLSVSTLFMVPSVVLANFKPACTSSQLEAILSGPQSQVHLNCSLILNSNQTLRKTLILEGSTASNTLIDCRGATLEPASGNLAIVIRSKRIRDFQYERPSSIKVQNCKIRGSVRTSGLGVNGEAPEVRRSSRLDRNHTARAQASAPTDITFNNNTHFKQDNTSIYAGPGSTRISILNSTFLGRSRFVSIYLDAESSHNRIENNKFRSEQTQREVIAIDGSAHNRIVNNSFSGLAWGGIYLYRNCGEGGTIRLQTPQNNFISGNYFYYENFIGYRNELIWREKLGVKYPEYVKVYYPSVYLGSRQGNRNYCEHDGGYNYGSSISNLDFADHNVVVTNRIRKLSPSLMIQNRGRNNRIQNNIRVN